MSKVFLEDSITLPGPVLKLEGRGVRYAPLMQPYDTKSFGTILPSPLQPEVDESSRIEASLSLTAFSQISAQSASG